MATQFTLFKCLPGDGWEMFTEWFCAQLQHSTIAFRSHEAADWPRVCKWVPFALGFTPLIKNPCESAAHAYARSQPVKIRAVGRGLHHYQPSLAEYHTVLREFKVNYAFLSKAHVHSNLTHKTREDNTLRAQDTIYQTLPCTMEHEPWTCGFWLDRLQSDQPKSQAISAGCAFSH